VIETLVLQFPTDSNFLSIMRPQNCTETKEALILNFMEAAHLRQEAIRNFEEACASGDIDTVTSIINEKKNPCNLESGLCIAIWSEKLDVARFLLEKGTPISSSVSNAATNRAKKTKNLLTFRPIGRIWLGHQ
jgi:hypothetical protein